MGCFRSGLATAAARYTGQHHHEDEDHDKDEENEEGSYLYGAGVGQALQLGPDLLQ